MKKMRLLLLLGEDGIDGTTGVLYPADWTTDEAYAHAEAAIREGQIAGGEDWTWEHIEPCLIRAGFYVPLTVFDGPTWETTR